MRALAALVLLLVVALAGCTTPRPAVYSPPPQVFPSAPPAAISYPPPPGLEATGPYGPQVEVVSAERVEPIEPIARDTLAPVATVGSVPNPSVTIPVAPTVAVNLPPSTASPAGRLPLRSPIVGTCDCPYDRRSDGVECGGTSAYSRPGGRAPACFVGEAVYKPPVALGCAENGSCYGDISVATGRPKTVHVGGYYRKDGTYVRGHYRSRPRR